MKFDYTVSWLFNSDCVSVSSRCNRMLMTWVVIVVRGRSVRIIFCRGVFVMRQKSGHLSVVDTVSSRVVMCIGVLVPVFIVCLSM